MRRAFWLRATAMVALVALGGCSKPSGAPAAEAAKKDFTIGWSIYTGWMPWPYAQQAGIVKKWADKYGINIRLVQVNDYVESVNQYAAGKLDGVVATTMDALTIPAAGGRDTTVLLIGDYSDGNDGIVLKNGHSMADIKGRSVNLVELSVSHFLLARGLELNGLKLSDVKTINTGDADIVGAFASPNVTAVATWNPQLSTIKATPGATEVFDSSKIPNEILDTMNVSTETLKANPNLGKALAGIWYETMALMSRNDAAGKAARAAMAKAAGTTEESFEAQLKTTHMYAQAKDAAAYAENPDLIQVTDRVRQFSFAHGLFGPTAKSVDAIGITFAGNKTLGDVKNVKLRFDPSFMKMAADGKL
ncbi:NitT/TauT family transport system substrate-binding protein [Sphingomonas vulcanisoli]|uniref:NitT/TauT family transport system substrate-binding protein n=1 Tax=Sphingomonas vulcanisoli TaxID=1658060 RepID=A0ABX0TPX2_9SPHN|nr:putative urea ABC transporter substrate-binding protein [Sphingomonas vulcanisoli]NIJ06665.1 NitT/TauT family transport system substrate-binding protein [Sphingomonas vulcanisoli]